jgi:putative selenate reductase
MFRELEDKRAIFDLPERKFFLGDSECDLSVQFHARKAGSPLGPAAGPQSQMAQNIVLSWLGGSRILELKTVQIRDDLRIARPCIDMQTVGYNIEWSQELKLEESLEEYVKGAMLVEILRASGRLRVAEGFEPVIYDMSVGYDLAGIRSDRVQAFIAGMLDATSVVERLRSQIPEEFREFRDLDFPTRLSDTLTLSTFHGCPSDEIERIIEFLSSENRLHCIVKLNPMLLGPKEARRLLHDVLGYDELAIPDTAFERDTRWDQMEGFVGRLASSAAARGLGFGVKFSNTLIVENHRDFFPKSEKEMYLSGPPLHVLAMNLVARFRDRFGDAVPISFAAGVDRGNFAEAVSLGLVPVTVCSDLLKPGGYGRQEIYLKELVHRMREIGARTIDDFVIRAHGQANGALERAGVRPGSPQHAAAIAALGAPGSRGRDPSSPARSDTPPFGSLRDAVGEELYRRWVSEARLLNTRAYVERATEDPRYRRVQNSKAPKKIGRRLQLFDCISCDKCVPVCPNDANFTFVIPRAEVPAAKVRRAGDSWSTTRLDPVVIREEHQIGNFADFCNDCGNCDVFCPEDGGPYVMKPRFFGSLRAFEDSALSGFYLERDGGRRIVHGRFAGGSYRLELGADGSSARYSGDKFDLSFDRGDPEGTLRGKAEGEVDLTYFRLMDILQQALLENGGTGWVSALAVEPRQPA